MGELSILLASKGHEVTAFDFSAAAIALARRKAAERGLDVDFRVADALVLPAGLGPFDAVFDSGLPHSLPPLERATYVAALRRLCRPGAAVHVLALSEAEFEWGLTKPRLEQLFADGFGDVRVEPATVLAQWNGPLTLPGWLLRATV